MSGVTFTVKKKKSLMPKVINAFDDYEITAGIFADAGSYRDSKTPVAEVASINEYGTDRIPSRPAFRTSFYNNRRKYLTMLKAVTLAGFKGVKVKLAALNNIGKEAQNDIEKSIAGGNWAANADSTQLAKGGGKQKINNPLIDSGFMISSVRYKVKKK